MAGEPVRLGSASENTFIFEKGSTITISDSGIQECSIKAIWPTGSTVLDNIPAAGTTYNSIFGNSYLPDDFKLDRSTDSSVQISYIEGTAAEVTFSFKRPDPNQTGSGPESRKVSFDTQFKHIGDIVAYILSQGSTGIADDSQSFGTMGLPEPVVTVRYNNPTLPTIGQSALALPGSLAAFGFPICNNAAVPWTFFVGVAGSGSGCVQISSANFIFKPNPFGWQLVGLAAEPASGNSFYDVTETWRLNYVFSGLGDINVTDNGLC